MIDRYTKAVLTVIAGALALLAWQGLAPPSARAFSECGSYGLPCQVELARELCTPRAPCYVDYASIGSGSGLAVRVVGN
jgi:hypothetical protein